MVKKSIPLLLKNCTHFDWNSFAVIIIVGLIKTDYVLEMKAPLLKML